MNLRLQLCSNVSSVRNRIERARRWRLHLKDPVQAWNLRLRFPQKLSLILSIVFIVFCQTGSRIFGQSTSSPDPVPGADTVQDTEPTPSSLANPLLDPESTNPLVSNSQNEVEFDFSQALTLDKAISLARANHVGLASLLAEIEKQEAERLGRRRRDVELRLTSESEFLRTGVRYRLPNPWGMRARREHYALRKKKNEFKILGYEWELYLVIREKLLELYFINEDRIITDQLVNVFKNAYLKRKELFSYNQATSMNVITSSQKYLEVLTEHAGVIHLMESKTIELTGILGITDDNNPLRLKIDYTTAIKDASLLLNVEELKTIILAHHSEVTNLRLQKNIASNRITAAKSQKLPWISFLEGSYEPWRDSGSGEWRVQAGIALPFLSPSKKKLRFLRSRYKFLQSALDEAEDVAINNLHTARNRVALATEHLERLEAETNKLMTEMEELLSQAERFPDNSAVLDAEVAILKNKRLKNSLKEDQQMAMLTLERVLGTPLP